MGARRVRSWVRWLVAAVLIAAAGVVLARGAVGVQQPATRSVHVTVADKDGRAPADLSPADFEIEEAGKRVAIEKVAPASKRLRVAVLVADSGTGRFQAAVAAFMSDLLDRAEFSVYSIVAQAARVNEFASARADLEQALAGIGPRLQVYGQAQVLETVRDVLPLLPRDQTRPVLLLLRAGGEAITPLNGNDVRDLLRRTGALMFTISTDNPETNLAAPAGGPGSGTGTGGGRGGRGAARGDVAATNEARTGWYELARVVEDGARESGGIHVRTAPEQVAPTARRVATELLSQIEISYTLPPGTKPNGSIKVTLKRKDLAMRAPSRRAL